jgi:hypothetical protein
MRYTKVDGDFDTRFISVRNLGDSFRRQTHGRHINFQYPVLSVAKRISVSSMTGMRSGHIIQLPHRISRDVLEGFGFAMSLIVDHTLLKDIRRNLGICPRY